MTVLNLQIDATNDDVNEQESGTMSALSSTRVNIGDRGADRNWGGRWKTGLSGLSGAAINTVTMTWLSRETNNSTFTGDWFAEDAAAPPEFAATDNNLTNRTKTSISCEGDGTDFGPWVDDDLEAFTGPGDGNDLADIIQELADSYDPSAIVLMHFHASGTGERKGRAFDHGPTEGCLLDIDFTASGGSEKLGAGDITASATVVSGSAVEHPGQGAINATATVVAVGNTGSLREGVGAINATATATAVGDLTKGGQGDIQASATVVAAGERTQAGAGAINATATVTARGELGDLLEATAAINATATVTAVGDRFIGAPPGTAVTASATVVAAAVTTQVAAGAIAASAQVTAIGDSQPSGITFTKFGFSVDLDPDTMPEDHTKFWIATLSAPAGGTARVRMFNLTLGTEVAGTVLTTGSAAPARLTSADLTLPSGVHRYRAEYGGTSGFTYTTHSAKLRVIGLEPS